MRGNTVEAHTFQQELGLITFWYYDKKKLPPPPSIDAQASSMIIINDHRYSDAIAFIKRDDAYAYAYDESPIIYLLVCVA